MGEVFGELGVKGKWGGWAYFYQTATREAHSRLVLRLLCGFRVCRYIYLCVRTYYVRNIYVTYIVAIRPCFSLLQQFRQLRLQDGY